MVEVIMVVGLKTEWAAEEAVVAEAEADFSAVVVVVAVDSAKINIISKEEVALVVEVVASEVEADAVAFNKIDLEAVVDINRITSIRVEETNSTP